jgi:ATP-binding cassette, subfamily C (CFTR/MRP), member 1
MLFIPDAGVPKTHATIPTTALTLAVSVGFVFLSHLEHARSVRPSSTLIIYHGFTFLFDVVRMRTIWALPNNLVFSVLFTMSVAVKLIITILESVEKNHCLQRSYKEIPRETTSGVFNRNVFWWLNPLLGAGFSKTMALESLPAIDERLNPPEAQKTLQIKWNSCKFHFHDEEIDHVKSDPLFCYSRTKASPLTALAVD